MFTPAKESHAARATATRHRPDDDLTTGGPRVAVGSSADVMRVRSRATAAADHSESAIGGSCSARVRALSVSCLLGMFKVHLQSRPITRKEGGGGWGGGEYIRSSSRDYSRPVPCL